MLAKTETLCDICKTTNWHPTKLLLVKLDDIKIFALLTVVELVHCLLYPRHLELHSL